MKALLIAAIVFFGLKAMAADVGEEPKSPCPYTNQSISREAKIVEHDTTSEPVEKEAKTISK